MLLLALALLAAPPSGARERIALTISGGVSLGSYEAGLTWAIVRYLRSSDRAPELVAVTGASAGAANGLMAAILWCEEAATRDDQPENNLFHQLWIPVGLEDLLPDDPSAYSARDAVFTAAPLERAFTRLRTDVLESEGVRFKPGCSVSIGFSVTRDRPEARAVAGLSARRQRFVIPWRFEVDAQGKPRIVSAPLTADRDSSDAQLVLGEPRGVSGVGTLQATQTALASGAFPFAFRPRQLCDCSLRCPEDEVVHDATCEGPSQGQSIAALSCDSVSPAGPRQLCKRLYIDGGIFDNAPIGLAVDLAEAAGGPAAPFVPAVYFFVDPDHRRLAPAATDRRDPGLAAPVQLLSSLIGTARETELARAIRDERWQRTTQSTLSELAVVQTGTAAIQEEMARIAGASADAPTAPDSQMLRSPRREALASFLLRCLIRLRAATEHAADPPSSAYADCADPLRDGTAGAGERHARPSPAEVVRVASEFAAFFLASNTRADQVFAEANAASTPFDRQLQLLALMHDVSTVAISSYRFLAGEVPSVAASGLARDELLQLRHDLLAVAGSGTRLLRATSAMLRVLLLATLLEEQVQGTLPAVAAEARATLTAGLDPSFESPALRAMADASERVARLIALAPRLRILSARAIAVTSDAAQLSSSTAQERQLVLSRRFAPLGGGALLNFSGFLDRPLRELDFYSGIYDAAMQIAVHECEIQGSYPANGRPAAVFQADAPFVVDPAAEDSQRCIGHALRAVVEALALRQSPRALFVVAKLSRLELAAQVGEVGATARLLSDPAWSWLGQPRLDPGDQLTAALDAVTSRKGPCHPGATDSLCLVDPTLDELLDALQGAGYVASSPSMRAALADRERWMARLAGKLVDRAAAADIGGDRPSSGVVTRSLGLAQLWARRAERLSEAPALDLDPSTIPRTAPRGTSPAYVAAAHAIPYRVSLDVIHGGAAFSFVEPSLRLTSFLSVDSIADLLTVEGSGRISTTLGLVPTLRGFGVALGAGAQAALPWNGDPVLAPGVVGRIALLQERLAITFGVHSLSAGHREALLSLSASDLNGLAYWLAVWPAAAR